MKSFTTRVLAVSVAVATALFVSSCSSPAPDGHDDAEHSSAASGVPQPAGHNAADVTFATNMVPHHQQAVDMSELVPERSTNPELIALAAKVSAAQEPEIQALRVFLVQWDDDPESNPIEHEGHGPQAMAGMVDDATMTRLASLKGPEFDTLWLQSMIGHHQGAIEMAQAEVADGSNVDTKRLASQIITAQQAEITQMKQMLGG